MELPKLPGGGGGTRSGFIWGCAAPGSEPLPYFREKRTPKTYPILGKSHYPGHWKWSGPGEGTQSENCWGCAVGHWKLDPKRSRGKWYFGAKKTELCKDLYPKDRFCVGGWEKTPQKDQVWYPEGQKRGSKPRHICITHHIGSTPPPGGPDSENIIPYFRENLIPKPDTRSGSDSTIIPYFREIW